MNICVVGKNDEKFSSFAFKEITYIKIIISPPINVIIIRSINQYEWVFKNKIMDRIRESVRIRMRLNIG